MPLLQEIHHSPTLRTILMVEDTIRNADKSLVTVAELKKLLPKQVNHQVLRTILEYLESSSKIAVTMKGITWIHQENTALQQALAKGKEI